MVLMKENNLPPLLWLLERVTKLIQGKDGVAGVAEVKTKKGHLLRAYNRLVTLPVEADWTTSKPGSILRFIVNRNATVTNSRGQSKNLN
ncbi:unnamed protein product [Parnassius mnemosyne]|uniref:DUF5641 domain-containing protein n=1 Tax=Parnassius mnemosyne TaxID=213953 RepID=A0AAV1M9W2_9NEOP